MKNMSVSQFADLKQYYWIFVHEHCSLKYKEVREINQDKIFLY